MVRGVNNDPWIKAQTFWIAGGLVIFRTYRRPDGSTYAREEYEPPGELRHTLAVAGCGMAQSHCRGRIGAGAPRYAAIFRRCIS